MATKRTYYAVFYTLYGEHYMFPDTNYTSYVDLNEEQMRHAVEVCKQKKDCIKISVQQKLGKRGQYEFYDNIFMD